MSTRAKLGLALGGASLVSIGLFAVGAIANRSIEFWYLNWNLVLAWVPLVLIVVLERVLRRRLWSTWQALMLTGLFIAFLPNTFYLLTDMIHLQEVERTDLMLDVAMFSSFMFNGCMLGLVSVYMLHAELRKRVTAPSGWLVIIGTLLVTSFALYIGRELRWNTWDILLNPASILFQVSESLLHPMQHPEAFSITLSFFVLLAGMYVVMWCAAKAARQQKTID